MPDLRSLSIDIGHKIDSNPILTADQRVDNYKKNITGTDKNVKKLGKSTTKTGKQMTDVGRNAERAARRGNQAFSTFNNTMSRIGLAIGGYFTFRSVYEGLKTTIGLAASLEEETAKFETVFKELADPAAQWATEYANSVGRSVVETKQALASSQSLFVGFGATRDQAFEFSKSLQQMGTDLASMNNLADPDVLNAMRSALVGNHEAARAFDVVLTESNLQMRSQRLGLKANFRELDPLTKAQVRFAEILAQSTDAVGDAERTQGSFTNQLKRLKGLIKDTVSAEGLNLLGFFTDLLTRLNENKEGIQDLIANGIEVAVGAFQKIGEVIDFVTENADTLVPALGGLVAGFTAFKILSLVNGLVLAFNLGIGATSIAAYGSLTPLTAFNALIAANPFVAVALAVAALVVAGIALFRNWDKVKAAAIKLWDTIKNALTPAFEFFAGLFDKVKAAGKKAFEFLGKVVSTFINIRFIKPLNFLIGLLNKIQIKVPDWVPGLGGKELGFNIPKLQELPGFQRGTMSAPAGMAVVGERGPELIRNRGGERIFSNATSRRMANNVSNSNYSPNVNIYVTSESGANGRDIAQKVRDAIDKYFRDAATREGFALNG